MSIPLGTYRHHFAVGGQKVELVARASTGGLRSKMLVDGGEVATDFSAEKTLDTMRNHHLAATLADGGALEVELGYVGWWHVGARAQHNGKLVFDSHPGKTIEFPRSLRRFADQSDYDPERQRASLVPLGVDIALGIIFYIVARMTDLTTAAMVGAVLGLGLLVVQRFVKVDLVGGLALFGVCMLLASAGFALLFNQGLIVQLRSVILGLASAACFLVDGWRGGPWLGRGLSRYIPYADVDRRVLALGMGCLGLAMAIVNLGFIWLASEDVWLFYTTFLDIPLIVVGFWFVMQRSRRRTRPA